MITVLNAIRNVLLPAAILIVTAAHAEHYNATTGERAAALPTVIHTAAGITVRPTADQLRAAGWILSPIRPATIPEGHEVTNRRIDVSAQGIPFEAVSTRPIPQPQPPDPDIILDAADVQFVFSPRGDFATVIIRGSTNQPPARLIP